MKARNNILDESFSQRRGDAKKALEFANHAPTFAPRIEDPMRLCASFSSICILLTVVFSGCSSAPKSAGEVFTDRNMAVQQLNLVNQTASHGRYDDALRDLTEARRLAVSSDDPYLRLRTSISRGDILFSLGRHDEAFSEWENASHEGDTSGEPVLASLARIYAIRAKLLLLANETDTGTATDAAVEELKAQLNREMAIVRNDDTSSAAGYAAMGLAEKALGRWAEAESSVRRALEIHQKNNALEDTAYDWYLIASIRSVAGNYDGAMDALRSAISFDRRAENGFGLASSWQAMGDVYQKAGRIQDAQTAWRRAAEIYRAIGLSSHAERLEGQY